MKWKQYGMTTLAGTVGYEIYKPRTEEYPFYIVIFYIVILSVF